MSTAKMNPATLNCSFSVTADWVLTYVDTKQQSKKGKVGQRRKSHRAGNVQSLSYTSKGVVDGN